MTCRELADFILDYLAGQLSAETALGVRAPFGALPELRQLHRQLQATVDLAGTRSERRGGELPLEMPEELVRAILASREANRETL